MIALQYITVNRGSTDKEVGVTISNRRSLCTKCKSAGNALKCKGGIVGDYAECRELEHCADPTLPASAQTPADWLDTCDMKTKTLQPRLV